MINFISNVIVSLFSKKIFLKFIDIILHLILKIKGYKNFGNFNETGEKFLIKYLKKKKVKYCIDIGAHKGDYSKELLKQGFNVIAFEPMEKSFKELEKLKKDYPKKFKCFKIALSDQLKNLSINFTHSQSQLASFSKNLNQINFLKNKKFKTKLVKTTTLDNFVKKNKIIKKVDFIKIDTEGYDLKVLKGSLNFLNKFKPLFIQIEMNYHYVFSGENLYQFVKILSNYKVYKILPFNNGLIEIDPSRPENNIFHLSNYLFKKK